MKKILTLVLALCMVFALAACGGNSAPAATETPATEAPATEAPETETPATEAPADEATDVVDPDSIEDNMTSADNTYEVAFVTDVGQLKDKSFNEGTWNGVKTYAYANGLSYKYYQPANGAEATDDDRIDAMQAAVDGGAKIVVCAGFLQETALRTAAVANPDVKFVFIDGYPINDENDAVLENVAGISYQEEQSGYLAGYAVVKEGYTELGFSGGGGGTNPACCRYGYGFVQGAAAAAEELGVNVNINYSWNYGANFQPSGELQTMISGWYENGTEIVFSCGGSIFDSITAAAGANDGYVVGVDVDQSYQSDYVVTSAMKNLQGSTAWAIGKFYNDEWADIGGQSIVLGIDGGYVGIPTDTWSMENFTVEEYETVVEAMMSGEITVDNAVLEGEAIKNATTDYVTINYIA